MSRYYQDLICGDCQKPLGYDYFMLRPKVWREVTRNKKDVLCIPCTTTRLGRELTEGDFDPAYYLNYLFGWIPLAKASNENLREIYLAGCSILATLDPLPPRFEQVNPDWKSFLENWYHGMIERGKRRG